MSASGMTPVARRLLAFRELLEASCPRPGQRAAAIEAARGLATFLELPRPEVKRLLDGADHWGKP